MLTKRENQTTLVLMVIIWVLGIIAITFVFDSPQSYVLCALWGVLGGHIYARG